MKCCSIYIVPQPQNNRACNIRLQHTKHQKPSAAALIFLWSDPHLGNHSKNHPTWSLARYTSWRIISVFVKSSKASKFRNKKFWNHTWLMKCSLAFYGLKYSLLTNKTIILWSIFTYTVKRKCKVRLLEFCYLNVIDMADTKNIQWIIGTIIGTQNN